MAAKLLLAEDLKPGDLVVRGPGWTWNDQDGGPGNVGTVVGHDTGDPCWVDVRWPNGSRNIYLATARCQGLARYAPLPPPPPPPPPPVPEFPESLVRGSRVEILRPLRGQTAARPGLTARILSIAGRTAVARLAGREAILLGPEDFLPAAKILDKEPERDPTSRPDVGDRIEFLVDNAFHARVVAGEICEVIEVSDGGGLRFRSERTGAWSANWGSGNQGHWRYAD